MKRYLSLSDISLNIILSGSIHIVTNSKAAFFFMAEYIPLYKIAHFFVHLSVDGHLGCFYVLAIVNNAAVKGCIYLFELVFLYSLEKYPGVKQLDHMVVLFLTF